MNAKSYDSSQHGKAPSPFIPLSFVAAALLTLIATIVATIFSSPQPLAVLHALAVGVFLTIALGLLYQFIPVVSLSSLKLPQLAYVHLVLALSGTGLLVYGFANLSFSSVFAGGALHATGLTLEVVVLARTVWGRIPPPAAAAAPLSIAWLVLTIGLGMFMASDLNRGISVFRIVNVHALAGLGGFFGTLIVGITLRLLRMFERVDRERGIAISNRSVHIGVAVSLLGGLARWLLVVSLIPFLVELFRVVRVRNPAYQPETLAYTLSSATSAVIAAIAYSIGNDRLATIIALWLFVGTAVTGYLQRIVPFIWWIRRAKVEGARSIPTLAEMNDSRLGYVILILWLSAGIVAAAFPNSKLSAVIALIATVALISQLVRPFVLKKRTQVSPEARADAGTS